MLIYKLDRDTNYLGLHSELLLTRNRRPFYRFVMRNKRRGTTNRFLFIHTTPEDYFGVNIWD